MKEFIEKLSGELGNLLSSHYQEKQPLRRLTLCKQAVQDAIDQLHRYTEEYYIDNPDDIILYNRQWAPLFYGKLIYFSKCYEFERINFSSSMEEKIQLYEHELTGIRHFFRRFSSFCERYYNGEWNSSELFPEENHSENLSFEEILLVPESPVIKARLLAAHLLANEQYRSFMEEELRQLYSWPIKEWPNPAWAYKASDATEVISALFELQAIKVNGKPAAKAYIQFRFEIAFGCKINDIDIVDNNNRFRQGEARFLEKMVSAYSGRGKRIAEAKIKKIMKIIPC